jgi:hypothetical protein
MSKKKVYLLDSLLTEKQKANKQVDPEDLTEDPLCFSCAHYQGESSDGTYTCSAYPSGIPDEILTWQWDHHNPAPGDGGITFKPK